MSRTRGPSAGDRRRLAAGFVLLVGFSGGLMALQGGASPAVVGASTLGGLVVGGALLWYLLRIVG
ncbi:hypothetical protein [Salinilacihabitans rarus]|uniref:hypothetical protein n=1 Tax=Salinilacihabitans rarus TaxID=2961596 RepID=UPI0020C92B06|nr:hypothetical protein [Salinilacihabitans rarus]